MQFGLHVGVIALPGAVGIGLLVEGVGKGVNIDAFELSQDDTGEHPLQMLVLGGQLYIGKHLCARVSQPHRVNVTRIYKGVGIAFAVGFGVVYRSVKGVGEAVDKHPCQAHIRELCYNLLNLLLDGIGAEQPFGDRRAVVDFQHIRFLNGDVWLGKGAGKQR